MKKIDLKNLTIKKAHDSFLSGEFSARDLAENYLENIKLKNPELNAYLQVFDDVLEQADKADERIRSGKADILTGIPMAVKDIILIKGKKATAGSKILENYVATYDATVIKKLKEAGVVFLGKTNLDEFAMGSSTENSAFGPSKNPYDISRTPGGSSGGSVVAVTADMALVALGTDTGGSIRQPASLCGIVGLKPTYGAVSRYGAMAMGSSLDQIGPLAKNVEDAKIVFDCIKGEDGMDSTTIPDNLRNLGSGSTATRKLTIGVPRAFVGNGVDKDVQVNFEESLEKFKSLGYEIKDIGLPNIDSSLAVYYILMPAEVSTNLARYDGVRYGLSLDGKNMVDDYFKTRGLGFGKEVRRRIILGTYVLSAGYYDAYYNKAVALREVIKKDFNDAFKEVDVILTPTSPTPAFKLGEKSDDPLQMYLADIFTVPANIAQITAISIPSGFTEREGKQLPLGIQLTAPYLGEELLFKISKDFLNEK